MLKGVSEGRPVCGGAPVEIVAIGDELLDGDVLDTNTNWLCRHLTRLGGRVGRAVLVRDQIDAISREIQAALARQATLVFTIGVLEPTADDRTLVAIATATNRDLEENPEALRLVAETFRRLAQSHAVDDADLGPARRKMALLPRGATPLANPRGAAPGVLLRIGATTLVCLPGVPAELRGIVEESLRPVLAETLGAGTFLEKLAIVACKDESALAPLLQRVAAHHPAIYVKSHAERYGSGVTFRVTLSARGHAPDQIRAEIDRALLDLRQTLAQADLEVASVEDVA